MLQALAQELSRIQIATSAATSTQQHTQAAAQTCSRQPGIESSAAQAFSRGSALFQRALQQLLSEGVKVGSGHNLPCSGWPAGCARRLTAARRNTLNRNTQHTRTQGCTKDAARALALKAAGNSSYSQGQHQPAAQHYSGESCLLCSLQPPVSHRLCVPAHTIDTSPTDHPPQTPWCGCRAAHSKLRRPGCMPTGRSASSSWPKQQQTPALRST
jgi:hypothetical protein